MFRSFAAWLHSRRHSSPRSRKCTVKPPRRRVALDVEYLEPKQLLATVQFPSATTSVDENGTAQLAVTLSAALVDNVTVHYATGADTGGDHLATAGSDYTSSSGTLTILGGDTIGYIQLPILDDSLDEYNETFRVTLSDPSGVDLG